MRRAAEEPVAGLAAGISGSKRGTGGDDGDQGTCGATGRVTLRIEFGIGCYRGLQKFHRAVRRAAEEPVAGLVAGISGSERGTDLGGGDDGG